MGTAYETDIVAWANEQAALLRSGRLSALDVLNIAEEIEDVGKSERRELESRFAVLLAHLLKWKFQADHRGASWRSTIRVQRDRVARALHKTPSLRQSLNDAEWIHDVWLDALTIALRETGLDEFPGVCPWSIYQIMSDDFFPD
jgi:hypothetical protein